MRLTLDAEIEALQARVASLKPRSDERAGALFMLRKLRTKQLAQIAKRMKRDTRNAKRKAA